MTDEKKVDAEAVDAEAVDAEAELTTVMAAGATLTAAGIAMTAAGTAMSAIGCLLMLAFLFVGVLLFGVVLWALLFG